MSTVATNEVVEFHRFLSDGLQEGSNWKTPEQALAFWRRQRPISKELAESVKAVQEAVDAMHAGDRGRPAAEVIAELRQQLGLMSKS